ncbi:uncharacterized protein N7484_011188 [Penicillium longicatenatum]|uniref:uncharacterized protein n=1 Tax=Penicillium longicatenatum TaxID=1561947 RepID=UPI002546909D|nr:uncharacterized protein N7484_011188 [Penicillium longicatenatum]KAJ5631088.1 hypothetical protein N7484_011188 [Penicillium longicatenatum]
MRNPATLPFRPLSYNTRNVSSPASLETARFHQKLILKNGRTLGYAEYGNPTDYPLLYFHGYPSSRLEGWGFGQWPERLGFRLIVPDRPGFGLSSYQPNRRILDWPADVEALISHLGLSRFAILGCSGGGPYAIACAHLLPAHMLSAVAVVAGAPPWVAGTKDVTLSRKLLSRAAIYCPGTLEMVFNPFSIVLRWIMESGLMTRWLDNWIDGMKREGKANERPNAKEEDLSTEEARKRMLSASFEAFVQGSGGAIQEARLLSQDWGFRFQDVPYDGIRIWHGTKDVNAPIDMVRYMVKRLPRPVFHELEEDHYTTGHHLEAIITDLIRDETGKTGDEPC